METSKGVCIFIDWYLPGYKAGGPIQSIANLVSNLSKYKKFYIVTRNTDYCDTIPYPSIEPNTWIQQSENVSVYYFSSNNLTYHSIKKIIIENHFETIYLNGIFSVKFTLLPLFIAQKIKNLNIIVGGRGMLAPAALAIKPFKKKAFLFVAKILNLFTNVKFHATNETEKEYIQNIFGTNNKIFVAPNLAKPFSTSEFNVINKEVGELKIVNIARVAPEKNLLYALQVMQHVKSKITFNIYGPTYNESYWQKCKDIIATLDKNINVIYHGAIDNALVNELLKTNHVMFMPTQGENFGHIILESLQAGRPVIISNLTPWNNLEYHNCGFDLSLDNINLFADKIDFYANMNQETYNQVCRSSFDYACKFMSNPNDLNANKIMFEI